MSINEEPPTPREYVKVADPPIICMVWKCFHFAHVKIRKDIQHPSMPPDTGMVGLCDIHISQIMETRFFEVKKDEEE